MVAMSPRVRDTQQGVKCGFLALNVLHGVQSTFRAGMKRFRWSCVIAFGGLLTTMVPAVATADGLVTGTITVDGKPLEKGKIAFHQRDGQFVGSIVKNGRYSIPRVPVGELTVTIEGKGVPAKYGSEDQTWFRVRIVEDVPNQIDVELEGEDQRGVPLPEDDPLLQAIQKRFGKPDGVRRNDRWLLSYHLPSGDWLTIIVSEDKVIGIEHVPQ